MSTKLRIKSYRSLLAIQKAKRLAEKRKEKQISSSITNDSSDSKFSDTDKLLSKED